MCVILFVDNDRDFLDTRAEYLELAGYTVRKAWNLKQARTLMTRARVHLVILDIRMIDDHDPSDRSGLLLARESAFAHIPKVVITQDTSLDTVRETLTPVGRDAPALALDFVSKHAGVTAMIEAVSKALANCALVNRDLVVRFSPGTTVGSFAQLACAVTHDAPLEFIADHIGAMEDLYRKIFADYEQVTIARLLWSGGNCAAVEVSAYAHNREESLVVVCGAKPTIDQMLNRMQDFLLDKSNGIIREHGSTGQFGALALALNDADIESAQSFTDFYAQASIRSIDRVLRSLYSETLGFPLSQRTEVSTGESVLQLSLKQFGLSCESVGSQQFEDRMAVLCERARARALLQTLDLLGSELRFSFPYSVEVRLVNPLRLSPDDVGLPICHLRSATTMGGLRPETILVDPSGRTWLTDLRDIRVAPIWWDFVTLEAAIRFRLTRRDDLRALLEMENQLLLASSLRVPGRSNDVEPGVRKAYNAIRTIRGLAVGISAEPWTIYLIELYACVIHRLQGYNPDYMQSSGETQTFIYALILAALIASKLTEIPSQLDEGVTLAEERRLRVDPDTGEAWFGRNPIELTETERNLLAYLARCEGKICSHEELLRNVFRAVDLAGRTGRSLLSTNVSRLRQKIEPNSDTPVHIVTERGRGYRFRCNPKAALPS